MPFYAELSDVKIIMRASSRERIRFSDDALRVIDVGLIEVSQIGDSYTQRGYQKPSYTLSVKRDEIQIDPSYHGRDLIVFIFNDDTTYNVYHQEFKDNAYDKREMLHGSGSISTTYDYDGVISFPPSMWAGVATAGNSVRITFECDVSNLDAEFFISQAEIALDNMLSSAAVDYLELGEDRIFRAPDIPPVISMAAQYLSAYYIYTNVFAEQTKDPNGSHFTDRWRRMCMDVLRDFANWKTRLPPSVVSRVNWNCNFSDRVKLYFDVPILCARDLKIGYSSDNEDCGDC